jgi:hypothetical protein
MSDYVVEDDVKLRRRILWPHPIGSGYEFIVCGRERK